MDEKTTRKFMKPLKGNGALFKSGQYFAGVGYFLQGWQDFMKGGTEADRPSRLSGMDGEITLGQEERTKIRLEEILGQDFHLRTEKHGDYDIHVYKLKDNDTARGRYSIRCKLTG